MTPTTHPAAKVAIHELKTDPAVFDAVARGVKTHEIRLNDRNFAVGDTLLLRETLHAGADMRLLPKSYPLTYTGRTELRTISHIQTGYGLADGWCILSFAAAKVATPILTSERIVELYRESFNAMVGRLRDAPKTVPDTVLAFARAIESEARAALAPAVAPSECQWPNCMPEKEQQDLANTIAIELFGECAPVQPAPPAPEGVDIAEMWRLLRAWAEAGINATPAQIYAVENFVVQQREAGRREESLAHMETINQRDHYHDIADKLAEGIGEHFGEDIGEHSSTNCPWDSAMGLLGLRPEFVKCEGHMAALATRQPVSDDKRDAERCILRGSEALGLCVGLCAKRGICVERAYRAATPQPTPTKEAK